ncbi:MAG: oligosaccharide flippase family protein [Thermofilum sp.]|nr:oligosaccharide flippase family protein [Thermofilum sp.]
MAQRSALGDVAADSAASAVSLFGGQVLATLAAGLSLIVLARLLGPEGYGRYSLSTTVASFLTLATDFGVSAALAREASRAANKEGLAPLAGAALRFLLLSSSCAALAGLPLSGLLAGLLLRRPEMAGLVELTMPLVVFAALFNLSFYALLGLGDAAAVAALPVVRDVVRGVLSPLLALPFGCEGAVAGFVAGYGVAAAAGVALLRRRVGGFARGGWRELRPMLAYGLPLYMSTALGTALGVYQNSVLAWFATDEEVGNLRAAANFATLIQLASASIASALFPAFSRLGREDAAKALRYAAAYSALVLAPAGAYAIAEAETLVRVVYGRAYTLAPGFLSLQAVAFLWSGLGTVALGSFFQGVGETKVNFRASLVSATVFVPLSLALAPALRAYGVVAALLAASLASTLYSLREAARRGASVDYGAALRVGAAALLAAPPAVLAGSLFANHLARLAASALTYLLAYSLLALLLGCLGREDIEALRAALSRTPVAPLAGVALGYEERVLGLARRLRRQQAP